MPIISKVQTYGKDDQYFRLSIPSEISDCLKLKSGDLLVWECIEYKDNENEIFIKKAKL